MAAITASMVKELRDKTNAGMMDCKSALAEADGDLEAAETILRKKGIADADKKAGRDAKEGVIASRILDDGTGILVEVNCETDFVAKNENFQEFVGQILDHIAQSDDAKDLETLLAQDYAADTSQKFEEFIKAKVGQLGENMGVSRFSKIKPDSSVVGTYIHMAGRVGVLSEVAVGDEKTKDNETFQQFVKDLNMQIAASSPLCVDRDGVPADKVEAEKDIFRDQMKDKPADIIERIIEGKIGKFYSQQCLLEQAFIKDGDKTINDLVAEVAKATGDDKIKVVQFDRYAVGEES
ncbi:MAG: translation elongation factor Ts [Verrucomicrobiales bacterium]|nr:translation elongation factor Ts [Verrucomicrobiales bacterium]